MPRDQKVGYFKNCFGTDDTEIVTALWRGVRMMSGDGVLTHTGLSPQTMPQRGWSPQGSQLLTLLHDSSNPGGGHQGQKCPHQGDLAGKPKPQEDLAHELLLPDGQEPHVARPRHSGPTHSCSESLITSSSDRGQWGVSCGPPGPETRWPVSQQARLGWPHPSQQTPRPMMMATSPLNEEKGRGRSLGWRGTIGWEGGYPRKGFKRDSWPLGGLGGLSWWGGI